MTHGSFSSVQFTRSGWQQFCRANRTLVARFIHGLTLKRELAAYLAAYERAGIHMDTECQEIRYDDGIYLMIRKEQGVWYITDVILSAAPAAFLPVYTVRSVLKGLFSAIVLVFTGWSAHSGKRDRKAVVV